MSGQRDVDYDLYYWQLPFRGQFIRAIMAYARKSWTEHDDEATRQLTASAPGDQPVPFMGPPVLIDKAAGLTLSQMPAITLYLGETCGLLPDDPRSKALTLKIVNDANDVIDELTLDGGREMWTKDKWDDFVPRLQRWLTIWETTGERNGLTAESGFLLGTEAAGIADIVTSILWSTMSDRFPVIARLVAETAPRTHGLSQRMQSVPSLARLKKQAFEDYGKGYCGGEIEKSLRAVAG